MANHQEADQDRNKFYKNLFPQETAKKIVQFFFTIWFLNQILKLQIETYFTGNSQKAKAKILQIFQKIKLQIEIYFTGNSQKAKAKFLQFIIFTKYKKSPKNKGIPSCSERAGLNLTLSQQGSPTKQKIFYKGKLDRDYKKKVI